MRSRIAVFVLASVLALGLTGCTKTASTDTTGAAPSAPATSAAEASAMAASNPDPTALLTVADVAKATGMEGVKVVEKNSTNEAIGRLNFANSDGVLVATLSIGDGTAFDASLRSMQFAREATGTGSMCYVGPSPQVSKVLSIFAAAKGDHAVIMKTFLKEKDGSETWLSIDQLQSLVGLALSRWPS